MLFSMGGVVVIGNICRVLGWETGRSFAGWAKAWVPGTDESKRGWSAAYKAFEALGVLFSQVQTNSIPNIWPVSSLNPQVFLTKPVPHKEGQRELIQAALPGIPSSKIENFISTVEGFYGKALSEGKKGKEALTFALARVFLKGMMTLPSIDEMNANEELQEKIEADLELRPYQCIITQNLIVTDGVYLRADSLGNPRERYHRKAITSWIDAKETDPMDRAKKTVADIKSDPQGTEFVKKKLFAMLYPELTIEFSDPKKVEDLRSKAFLLALGAAYPLIKEKCEKAACRMTDSLEVSVRNILDRFLLLVEGMNFEGEEVVLACFPVVEELLREVEKKLTANNLEDVQKEFVKKLGIFITYFHEIEGDFISSASKENALKLGKEAIGKGASLEEVMGLFVKFRGSIIEEDNIRKAFPGCLLGELEWITHLGAVEKVPLPNGILAVLSGPCPVVAGKKVGETHLLVLIPEKVNGQPLTLNSLGLLVKGKGHFPNTKAGYRLLDSYASNGLGNNPTGKSHYILMTKEILLGSRCKNVEGCQAMVAALSKRSKTTYEVPLVLPVVTGVLLNYLASGVRLFSDSPLTYTRCLEGQYDSVFIGGFSVNGLQVCRLSGMSNSDGVAVLRRF